MKKASSIKLEQDTWRDLKLWMKSKGFRTYQEAFKTLLYYQKDINEEYKSLLGYLIRYHSNILKEYSIFLARPIKVPISPKEIDIKLENYARQITSDSNESDSRKARGT
jgi:hypothetical protein